MNRIDPLLAQLVESVEEDGKAVPMTIYLGGTGFSGLVIATYDWRERHKQALINRGVPNVVESFEEDDWQEHTANAQQAEREVREFRERYEELTETLLPFDRSFIESLYPKFMHLADVVFVPAGTGFVSVRDQHGQSMQPLRIRLDDVSAWQFGQLREPEKS